MKNSSPKRNQVKIDDVRFELIECITSVSNLHKLSPSIVDSLINSINNYLDKLAKG